jgi:hypothetical protein
MGMLQTIRGWFGFGAAAPAAIPAPPAVNSAPLADARKPKTMDSLILAGMINGGDDALITSLRFQKLFNRAAYGDPAMGREDGTAIAAIRAAQQAFRAELDSGKPFAQLVQEGAVNRLVEGYMGAQITEVAYKLRDLRSREQEAPAALPAQQGEALGREIAAQSERLVKLQAEAAYYQNNPAIVQREALAHPNLLLSRKSMPFARLIAGSGRIAANPDVANDLMNDVLSVRVKDELRRLGNVLPGEEYVRLYQDNPAKHEVQIIAAVSAVAGAAVPIGRRPVPEKQFPGLDALQAMQTLINAQFAAAAAQALGPRQQANMLGQMRGIAGKYRKTAAVLAYHFLAEGPAKDDPRIQAMRAHLEQELSQLQDAQGLPLFSRQDGRPMVMTREQARENMRALARASAEDILALKDDSPPLRAKLDALAAMAGVPVASQPLSPQPQLKPREPGAFEKRVQADDKALAFAARR